MPNEKWLISPGDTRVIDVDAVAKLKVGLVGGQVDIVAHDEPTIRIEVHSVSVKELRIELTDDLLEIDHPQLRWDNFLEVFRNFTATGPKAEISIGVPRNIALNLGVVSATALVAGLENDAKLNTVSGDILVDGLLGDLNVNAVSGEVQVRGLEGRFNANTVSGDVAVVGEVPKVTIDTVSGDMLVDALGNVHDISLNTVSGKTTIRLNDDLAANYVMRTISGKIILDGQQHSTTGPNNVTTSRGDLSGTFVDARVNGVSGDITVLRRQGVGSSDSTASGSSNASASGSFETFASGSSFPTPPQHQAPADPESPAAPETPAAPTAPVPAPGAPEAPQAPGAPEVPSVPEAPAPDAAEAPAPEAPEFPEAPEGRAAEGSDDWPTSAPEQNADPRDGERA